MTSVEDDRDRPFKLQRPHQLDEVTPDQIVALVFRLAMEISVLRDRLSTQEHLLARSGLLSLDDIEEYRPSESEAASRQRARTHLIEKIIKDLI